MLTLDPTVAAVRAAILDRSADVADVLVSLLAHMGSHAEWDSNDITEDLAANLVRVLDIPSVSDAAGDLAAYWITVAEELGIAHDELPDATCTTCGEPVESDDGFWRHQETGESWCGPVLDVHAGLDDQAAPSWEA